MNDSILSQNDGYVEVDKDTGEWKCPYCGFKLRTCDDSCFACSECGAYLKNPRYIKINSRREDSRITLRSFISTLSLNPPYSTVRIHYDSSEYKSVLFGLNIEDYALSAKCVNHILDDVLSPSLLRQYVDVVKLDNNGLSVYLVSEEDLDV